MDAKTITEALVRHLASRSAEFVLPNFCYGNNELDAFALTRSGLVVEYEVKVSRSDYLADFKKVAWNRIPVTRFTPGSSYSQQNKHELLKGGNYFANRFFFVVPAGLVTLNEVPPYAGLIYYKEYGSAYQFEEIRPGKMLHKEKAPANIYKQIATKCYYRYFELYQKLKQLKNEKNFNLSRQPEQR